MILAARSEIERSMISATAMTEASRRNQMGQPAAWTIANNAFPYRYFGASPATVRHSVAPRQVSAPQQSGVALRRANATCSGFRDIHKKLWIKLWIVDGWTVTSHLESASSWWRSKFEQDFSPTEQFVTPKNRAPRAVTSPSGATRPPMWISVGSLAHLTSMPNDFPGAAVASGLRVLSVAELLRSVRDTLERRFPLAWVRGELSNLSRAPSGHCYFTLKDAGAQVDCVMFRSRSAALDWEPRDGMQVEVRALPTLYEPRGRFQLNVEAMRRAGLGPLYERFLRLKEKLGAEGLFAPELKREPPAFPRTIGVLTSLAAAALRDVLSTLARRNPAIEVIVYPVPVQGDGAAARIASMLARANRRAECDVLLLVRGGGSIEDLWQFNEEAVARAIRASRIPVVVGVGHETDFTIADFAADRRAPTPSAAAELVSPSRAQLAGRVADCGRCLAREMERKLRYAAQTLD